MAIKVSKYTIFHRQGEKLYLYHQLSKTLLEIDEELYTALTNPNLDILSPDVKQCLENAFVLIDESIEESDAVKAANFRCRYNSDSIRITILPTLNCNFQCWYCYENHKPSRISKEGTFSILEFIKKETISKSKKNIILDWFGGEPMLCFNSIIYPFSKQLISWCKENNITLYCMTTTNGSLINENNVVKINEIGLSQFQITLDGGKELHNKTRFSNNLTNSYDTIVSNIHLLCNKVKNIHIELRINYTPENIHTLSSILDDFDFKIRHKIQISPHIVWQKSDKIMDLNKSIQNFCQEALIKGYSVPDNILRNRCLSCYTENADQYVINYDLSVYKCTARDYDKKYSIGKILPNGKFLPNGLYYKYITETAPFINEECLKCNILPSCMFATSCLQKKIEGSNYSCCRELITESISSFINKKIISL
ncbi:radical SAM protein [Prevotella sp. HUN102]|uniref:radical SAM/SPASM domain-containing protein n=1 Tax=Prevotella sp. HUN102 TaxID=1392486 RepID=UPI00048C04C6|nr:radical SAM protein [Prevotella sp. HUN102]